MSQMGQSALARRKRSSGGPEPSLSPSMLEPATADLAPAPASATLTATAGHSLGGFAIQRGELAPCDSPDEQIAYEEGSLEGETQTEARTETHAEGRASGRAAGRMTGAIQRAPDDGSTSNPGDTTLGGNLSGDDAIPLKGGSSGSTTIHAPTLSYDDYSAPTLADVASLFPSEVGSVTFDFTVSTSGDPVTSARLDVTQEMRMPRWLDYSRQCLPVKRAWDSFYAALKNHEDGHVTRDNQGFGGQHTRFIGQAQSDTQSVSGQLRTDVQATQDAYDSATDHGRTQTPPTILDTSVTCSPGGSSSGTSSGAPSAFGAADLGDYSDTNEPAQETQTMQAARAASGDQRLPADEIGASVRSVIGAGGGQPLDEATRAFMEPRFGHNFSQVRVHTDAESARSAAAARALAYTVGNDIVFAPGRYAPDSSEGRHLLAHELTHVAQQDAGSVAGTPLVSGLTISDPGDSYEQAAEATARRIVAAEGAEGAEAMRMPPAISPASLQGVAGIQRWTMPIVTLKSNDELLRDGSNGDLQAIKEISDFSGATDDQRIAMIRTLLNQSWVGPRDEYALEAIWRSFGDRVMTMAAAHMDLWRQSADRGAELKETVPQVKPLVTKFPQDVKDVVTNYLFMNRQVTTAEMGRLGIPATDDTPMLDPNDAQTRQIQGLQQAAAAVAKLQTAQEDARQIYVGYNVISFDRTTSMVGAKFDPLHRPDYTERTTNLLMPCDYSGPITPYDQVKEKYDAATQATTAWQTLYPDIYAISREGESATTATFAAMKPAQARQKLGSGMRALLHDIDGVQIKLDDGDLNPLDLTPIHDQLLHNRLLGGAQASSATNWADPVPDWVARELVKDHQFSEALKTLALQSVATAAFLLAPFTGGASLYVMLAGLAATGIQAYRSAENYEALAQAAQTAVTPGTELVTPGQVNEAEMRAESDVIALALAALAVGMAAAGEAIGAIKGPSTPKPLDIPQGLSEEQFQAMSATVRNQAGEISPDIQVQGSRAAGTARPDSDIDIAIRVPQEQFDQLIDDSFGKPNPGSAKARTMQRAIETGKIQSGEAGLRPLRKTLQGQLGMDVDISIVRIGGPFDNGPMIPLK